MISMNSVQILGKVTLAPRIRTLKNSGSKVGEFGLGIPENFRKENGEWDTRMHFVDVVVWGELADSLESKLSKGDGALVQGALQFDQWQNKEGEKRSKLRVKAFRVNQVPLPQAQPRAAG